MADALFLLFAGKTGNAEANVSFHRQPGKDAALLEDEDAPRVRPVHDLTTDFHDATCRGQKTSHDVQQRRFAAPGRAEKTQELALSDLEADVFEDDGLLAIAIEDHSDVFDLQ
jgi:hypothetical protein